MADKRFVAKNGLDNNSQTITNVADPVNAQDAATRAFASNASNLTSGTLALARGGTGASTQAGAANAILPSQTSQSGKYLTTDGTNVSWGTVSTGTSVTVSDDTATNATRYVVFEDATSGTVSTVNVSSTKLTFNPSTGTLAATVFSGSGASLTSLNAGNVSTGTLAVARGGTGISSYTTGNYIYASGTTTLAQRTPANVRSDISAEFQQTLGVPRANLGDPTVREMALFDEEFDNKTAFHPTASFWVETSTDGTTWVDAGLTTNQKERLIGGDTGTSWNLPYNTPYVRVRLRATYYSYINALYAYTSTNGHTMAVQVYKKHDNDGAWTQHTNSATQVSTWPGHVYLPFSTIPWHNNATQGTHFHEVYVVFIPTWNATHSANGITFYRFQLWGGYPAAKRNVFTTDEFKNITFPAAITATTVTATTYGGTFTASGASPTFNTANTTGTLSLGTTAAISQEQRFRLVNSVITGGVELVLNGAGTNWGLYDRHASKWVLQITRGTPDATTLTGTLSTTGSIQAVGGSVSARAAAGQDAVVIQGRAGGTSGYNVVLTPTTLTASRTLTLADGDTTLVAGTMVPTTRTLTIANGTGITGGGAAVDLSANRSWTIALTGQALAFHNLASTGLVARTAADTVAARTITGTANQVTVTNGDGVAGNPTLSLPADVDITTTLDVGSVGAITAATLRVGGDIRASGTIYANDFVLTGGAGSGTGLTLDSLDDVITTSPYAPTDQQVLTFDVAAGNKWIPKTVSGGGGGTTVTIADDTTTNGNRYLSFVAATSGTASTLNVASTKLTFNPSTGVLTASGGFYGGGGTLTGQLTVNSSILMNRDGAATRGILWYSNSYTAWQNYMGPASAGQGASGTITAPAGTLVTSWALRSFIENAGGYGWTFESGVYNATNPAVQFEIRSSDGSWRSAGSGTVSGALSVGTNLTVLGTASVQRQTKASYDETHYAWGGSQDLNWKRVARIASSATDGWRGTSGYLVVYDENSNHGVAQRTEYHAKFYVQYSSGGTPLDNPSILGSPGAGTFIRLRKLATRDYELQVRQNSDWKLFGAVLQIDSDSGSLTAIEPSGTPPNGSAGVSDVTMGSLLDNINISGSAANVTGTVAVANGGTGATTQAGAANAILPSQTSQSGKYLTTDGTNVSWATVTTGSSVTVSDDTTTNATRYLLLEDVTSGTVSTVNVSSTKLTFNPSTGILTTSGGFAGLTSGQVTTALGYTPLSNATSYLPLGGGTMTGAITFAAGQTWPVFNQNTTGTAANVTGTVAIANGGTGSTTQAGARTGLGATTVGANLFTLGNPGAITFLRINADNTVSALDAATFRTAIGAGTGSGNGTVTSVSGTGTVSGLTLSGTVTTTGNLTLSGTLSVTPSNFASQTANTVLAAPNGSAGVPTFRTLVLADLPSSILRSVGHPNYGNWDTFGNEEQTVREIYQEHFNIGTNTGSSNFPSNASYKYGTLVNFGAGASARAQVYISHTGNDLVFRGGWTTNSWQTWNRVLTDQNYTAYSPSLTGAGATGTNWGISITGNAATVTNGVYLSGAQDISGNKRFRNTPGFAANSASFEDGLSVYQATGGSDAMLTFHIAGDWAGHFGLGGAENDLVWTGWSVGNTRHRILHSGNYNLFTAQGSGINYASSSAWTTTNGAQTGYFGGNFNLNGDGSENQNLYRGDTMPTPFASPGLVWVAQNNDTSSNADGGWDKSITGLDPNKTYRSIVWFRRNSSSTNGTWYHGCADCLYPNGTAVGNPYFNSQGIGAFTQGRWYLSVGYIHANNDGTATSNYGGIYDSVTGAKVFSNNDFRMGSGQTTQTHRTYLYYSTDPSAVVEWWAPRFEEVNGNEPSINSLLMGSPEQKVIVTSTNVGSYALPISGGTMTGAITFAAGQTWPTFNQSTTGNAATATTLQTARNINGTSFNGSANITTASWGTARTITIGSTGKSVDGSANVSWTLGEIGALGASAKAADSELLDGLDSSVFVYGANGSGARTASATQNVYELAQYKAGFWDANGAGWTPDNGWWWGATFAHVSNSGSYNYSGQLAFQNGGGGDNLYARTISNGSAGSWSRLLSSGNYSSYALPLSGGVLSGTLSFSGSTLIRSDNEFQFLYRTSGGAQNARFNGIQVGSSYSGGIPTNGILFGTDTTLSRSGAAALTANGTLTASDFILSSDVRLKTDLVPLTSAVQSLEQVNAYRYTHTKHNRQEVGVLAQEIRKVLPEAVTEDADGMLGVSYDRLVPLLIAAVKELSAQVKALQAQH